MLVGCRSAQARPADGKDDWGSVRTEWAVAALRAEHPAADHQIFLPNITKSSADERLGHAVPVQNVGGRRATIEVRLRFSDGASSLAEGLTAGPGASFADFPNKDATPTRLSSGVVKSSDRSSCRSSTSIRVSRTRRQEAAVLQRRTARDDGVTCVRRQTGGSACTAIPATEARAISWVTTFVMQTSAGKRRSRRVHGTTVL